MKCERNKSLLVSGLVMLGFLFVSTGARAQSDPAHGAGAAAGGGHARGEVLDNRYQHGYYYPARGAAVRALPPGYRPYYFHGRPYYFYGGIWYAPGPFGFVVVGAPIGLYVWALPPYYTTVWIDGIPYYYANDTYYQWAPDMNSYEVVAPPANAEQPGAPPSGPAPAPPGENFYIYPGKGQTEAQQAADRYECYTWAKSQTGFDPTKPGGAVPPDQNASKSAEYRRAMTACLEARGYSVK